VTSEGEHQPPSDAAAGQQAVRLGGVLGGQRPGHAEGQHALLGLLPETVQRGPKDFFGKYVALAAKDPALPPLPADLPGAPEERGRPGR